MVLRSRTRLIASALALASSAAAGAQELDRAAPVLDLPADDYAPLPIRIGRAEIIAAADARAEYDDNIYAAADGEIGDLRLLLAPRLLLSLDAGRIRVTGRAETRVTRYLDQSRENSTGATLGGAATWSPTQADRVTFGASWKRLVEDRGEPSARETVSIGPRLFDAWRAEAGYARRGPRILVDVRGALTRFDYRSAVDAERDQTTYTGSARLGYQVSGLVAAFVEGFGVRRDYRLARDRSGVARDATTLGARVGVSIDPGGLFRGDAAVGAFRLDPANPDLPARTGLSAQAGIIYLLTRRLGITFDAFAGDVATVRSGAQARTDTRLRLGVQQEVRRNLRWQAGAIFRRTNFVGSGARERTIGGFLDVEYLINRRLAVAATSRYAVRNSSLAHDDFERFRGGIEFRVQY